jgi:hypothetical protein
MNNDAIQKTMALHCKTMAKAHEAAASAHESLSECFKSEQSQGLHKGMKDMHADLQSCHKSMAESYGKLGDACKKSDMGDLVKAITASIVEYMDKKYGNMIVPDGVRKTFTTEDPFAPAPGLTLMPRSGGPTPPTNTERIDPSLRALVQE